MPPWPSGDRLAVNFLDPNEPWFPGLPRPRGARLQVTGGSAASDVGLMVPTRQPERA